MSKADFWQKDQDEISRLNQERSALSEQIETWQTLFRKTEDAALLAEMALEEKDKATLQEVARDVESLEHNIKNLELRSLLGKPDDRRNAIVAINAGAGGTEAQDWVEMLFRMYTRWAEAKGMKVQVIDFLAGGRSGHQECGLHGNGALCLWIPEIGARHSPHGPDFPL